MPQLHPNLVDARERLAAGYEQFKQGHNNGTSGVDLCAEITELRDTIVTELLHSALADLGEDSREGLLAHIALVAHGGYGRCDLAPLSDIDLMILHDDAVKRRVVPLAEQLLRDLFDTTLVVGHSVRTPGDACWLALEDPVICTSLIESRLLAGDAALFEQFQKQFCRQYRQRCRQLIGAVVKARRDERHRFGDTVFLLQPNVKRSPGGLRDLQLLRWVGLMRYGLNDPDQLRAADVLSEEDATIVEAAREFLLRLRNELHFHSGRADDVLDRGTQVRIARLRQYPEDGGLLPVEQFMRDYFRHTGGVSHVVHRFVANAESRDRLARMASAVFGHRVEGGIRVGITGIILTQQGLASLRGNLVEIMRLVGLSNLYDKPIAPATWEVVRREAARLPEILSAEACRRFLSLLAHPARLGSLLRDLHDIGILRRFVPEFEHARGLLQFNQYHQYTVDEHCLRSVEAAAEIGGDEGPLGRAFDRIQQKYVLHLALLIHDLGKGSEGDHRQLGEQIAARAAARLGMPPCEAEALKFLVRHHDLMNHLAFRRDTSAERLVVRFAVQVGSPELLRILFVMTAADLAAVGPRVWDQWKSEVLTDLYCRAMQHLAGEPPATIDGRQSQLRPETVVPTLARLRNLPGASKHIDRLPPSYLLATKPEQLADDLRVLSQAESGRVIATARYWPETETVEFTVGASEEGVPGIFHRLTGALTGKGLQIRSAEIHTLSGGLVLDRFRAHDPDYAGRPPDDRLEEINAALVESLQAPADKDPVFRRVWQAQEPFSGEATTLTSRVQVDNTTSEKCTILDIFTRDRRGLLYVITRILFELGLSVSRAKISTYGNQVIDVFYVVDNKGSKITSEPELVAIRERLQEAVGGCVE